MTRDEIRLVKQIVREVAQEEIQAAIKSLREELKTKPEIIEPKISSPKKEVK